MKQLLKQILCVGVLSFVLSSQTMANALSESKCAYDVGDYATAAKLYKSLAEKGSAPAQLSRGLMYYIGKGVPQDYKEAANWYRRAATQGYAPAQQLLGLMYEDGKGVPQDYKEAANWYRKASAQGYAPAQSSLGAMYEEGKGVPQDYKEAMNWYRQASEQGYAPAQNLLGAMYESGKGAPQDYVLAHMWTNIAAANEDSTEGRNGALKQRDSMSMYMTAEQIVEAHELARRCTANKFRECLRK